MNNFQIYDRIYYLLRKKFPFFPNELIKDALSEAFKRTIESNKIKEVCEFEKYNGYLFKIAKNILFQNFNKKLTFEIVEKYFKKQETDNFYCDKCMEMLMLCCAKIDLKHLEIIVWTEIEGYTYEELAKWFKISESALRKRKSRAIKSMREYFKKNFKNDVTNLNLKDI